MVEKYIEATGKNEEAAVAAGLAQLGLERDDVSVEIIARAKTGFLGIGSTPAKVKLTYMAPDEPKPEQKREAIATPAPEEKVQPEAQEAAQQQEPGEAPAAPKKSRNRRNRHKNANRAEAVAAQEKIPAAPVQEEAPVVQSVEIDPAADEKAAQIDAFLTGLMQHMGNDAKPVIRMSKTDCYDVELVGSDLGALIGRRGETLDAIQQLTNYSVNRGNGKRARIHLDAENYRVKREETLVRLAQKTAGKALKYHRNLSLEPMNAYERHVIHAALQDYPGVTTYSTGQEPNRRIVVAIDR